MSYYVWDSKQSYGDYLQTKSFVQDISDVTREASLKVSMEISSQTREIIASNSVLANENIQLYQEKILYELQDISTAIGELNATFHWGFARMIAEIGHMNDTLSELVKIAKTPVQTVAYNHFEIARDAFRQGLYSESLDELGKAINGDHTSSGYKLEWRFHKMRGSICLGFVGCDILLIDHKLAQEAFLLAARYARTDFPLDAASALLAAGWALYCQGKMDEAISITEQAIELHPKFGEAFFQIAKAQIAMGNVKTALSTLCEAIELDRFFVFKAASDGDFKKFEVELREFFEHMRKERYDQICQEKEARSNFGASLMYMLGEEKTDSELDYEQFLKEGKKLTLLELLAIQQS